MLNIFMPLVFFYTLWKHHGFLMFASRIERDQWHEIGQGLQVLVTTKEFELEAAIRRNSSKHVLKKFRSIHRKAPVPGVSFW